MKEAQRIEIEKLKKIAIISLVSDDTLMEALVLKGGNAMQLYKIGDRASFDLDYSLEEDYNEEIAEIESRMQVAINKTFKENGYETFDFQFVERPTSLEEQLKQFWGGYKVNFKIIKSDAYKIYENDIVALRRNAISVDSNKSTKFKIDISKHEYTELKSQLDVDGYTVYVYSPQMIVFEKLRAICQQNIEYSSVINTNTQRGRSRDFYDIYELMESFPIDISSVEAKNAIKSIFEIKRVPIGYIKLIRSNIDKHRIDFISLQSTVNQSKSLNSFDFYFDYLMEKFENLFD